MATTPSDSCDPAHGEHGLLAWWRSNGRWAVIPELLDMFVLAPAREALDRRRKP